MRKTFVSARWKIKHWWWNSSPYSAYYKLRYRLTGDCGHFCDNSWLVDIENGTALFQFVPEDGCPIHDTYDKNI